jgi:hypothetical protein
MKHYQELDRGYLDYGLYELPGVRPHPGGGLFRGPAVTGSLYVACVGAAQTFGRFAWQPFPTLLRERLRLETLNLGSGGAGPRFHAVNPPLMEYINGSRLAIVQVLSGRSVSNSMLRLENYGCQGIRVADGLRMSAEDFYTDLLLTRPDLVDGVIAETRETYLREMRALLDAITVPKVLFWFSVRPPEYTPRYELPIESLIGDFPQLVNRSMVDELRGHADAYVECVSTRGLPQQLVSAGGESRYNYYYPSPEMHAEAADLLAPACRRLLLNPTLRRPPVRRLTVRRPAARHARSIYLLWNGAARHHRSGWAYALRSLVPLHSTDGVLFDTFIEKKFAWGGFVGDRYNAARPYLEPWVGVIHNPPNVPDWFNLNEQSPTSVMRTELWRESLPQCQGLFTLSAYLRDWLQPRVPVPVEHVLHPTGEPGRYFEPARYLANPDPKLVQVGWWLRKFHSLYRLDTPRLRKALLRIDEPWVTAAWQAELDLVPEHLRDSAGVHLLPFLDNDGYDELLAENVVFLDLYDSSANNAVLECLSRGTPLVVTRLPAVMEYLGEDYPLYFTDLDEAAAKAQDRTLVLAAHRHLMANPLRERLTGDTFRRSIAGSEIYRSLGLRV